MTADVPRWIREPFLTTTIVGSLPIAPSKQDLMGSYFSQDDPFETSIKEAVRTQISNGIQLVSDGQTRGGMIEIFASRMNGVKMASRPKVVDRVTRKGPIVQDDLRAIVKLLDVDSSDGGPDTSLKGILTGPYTLAMSMKGDHYGDVKGLAFDLASAINEEAREVQEIVPFIQVDEPFMSVEYPQYGRDLVARTFDGIDVVRALHICGDVSPIFGELAHFDVDLLDHEFSAHPTLLDEVKDVDHDKLLGYGSVRSDAVEVETVEEITAHIEHAVDAVGPERLFIDPDCGMKHLPLESAMGKLKNMCEAAKDIRSRL